jgi:hypothetical protein
LEPTSVTHGTILYNSICRFDDQARCASAGSSARTNTSGCRAMTTSAESLQAPNVADQADTIISRAAEVVALARQRPPSSRA